MNWAAFSILWLLWLCLDGDLTPLRMLLGAVLSCFVLLVEQRLLTKPHVRIRPLRLVWLGLSFAASLVRATAQVALHVVRPEMKFRPAILALPLRVRTNEQIAALANLVTLTPATVTLDISEDRSIIYVHVLDARNVEPIRKEISNIENRVANAIQ